MGENMLIDYSEDYYQTHREGVHRSAREIVPLVLELVQPRSVIDIGCGAGGWLSVFRDFGVLDIYGVDGSCPGSETLEIPKELFLSFDLRNPLEIDRQFDLVVSLEVAEHLPPERAKTFIRTLTQLGPVILFSAAVPLQEGVNHLNEQWPEYWVEQFENEGYRVVDPLRKKIWQNDNVEFWYIQNILMFVQQQYLESNSRLRREFEITSRAQLALIHPRLFLERGEKCLVHGKKAEYYIAEAEQLKTEVQASKEKVEYYVAENEQLKAEAQVRQQKAEHYVMEVEQLKTEVQMHKQKVGYYVMEVEQLKAEVQSHKETAEYYIAEAERLEVGT